MAINKHTLIFVFLVIAICTTTTSCKKDKFNKRIEGSWKLKSAEIDHNYVRYMTGTKSDGTTYTYAGPKTNQTLSFDGERIVGEYYSSYFYLNYILRFEADDTSYDIDNEMEENWTFTENGEKLTTTNIQTQREDHAATDYILYRRNSDGSFFSLPTSYYDLETVTTVTDYDAIYTSKDDLNNEFSKLSLIPISGIKSVKQEIYVLNSDGTGFTGDYFVETGSNQYLSLVDYNAKSPTKYKVMPNSKTYTVSEFSKSEMSLSALDSTKLITNDLDYTLKYSENLKLEKE